MPFAWHDYFDLAKSLREEVAAPHLKEARLRSAMSRAYFAAFCHARNYATEWLGFEPSGEAEDHGRLRAHFKKRRRQGVADRLDQLRQWRNDADYLDEMREDLELLASSALRLSAEVFVALVPPISPKG